MARLIPNCLYFDHQNFNSTFVVQQQNEKGAKPFKLQVFKSLISNGNGGSAFSNLGGELSLEDVTVTDSTFMSLVSSSSLPTDAGSTFLRNTVVQTSAIMVRVWHTFPELNPFRTELAHTIDIPEYICRYGICWYRCHDSND
jgi:hypothetical protein